MVMGVETVPVKPAPVCMVFELSASLTRTERTVPTGTTIGGGGGGGGGGGAAAAAAGAAAGADDAAPLWSWPGADPADPADPELRSSPTAVWSFTFVTPGSSWAIFAICCFAAGVFAEPVIVTSPWFDETETFESCEAGSLAIFVSMSLVMVSSLGLVRHAVTLPRRTMTKTIV